MSNVTMQCLAGLATGRALRTIDELCESQSRVGTWKLSTLVATARSELGECAFQLRKSHDALLAERDQLRAEIEKRQLTIDGMNEKHWELVQAHAQLRAELEAIRGQQPVAWRAKCNTGFILELCLPDADDDRAALDWEPLHSFPPQQPDTWPTLDKPAKVGAVMFNPGLSARLVVEAAQRQHEHSQQPEVEAARLERFGAFMQEVHGEQPDAVSVPRELLDVGHLIRTQDNRCTDAPLFAVMKKRPIVASPDHDYDYIEWVNVDNDYAVASEVRARRLEALYEGCRDIPEGWERFAMKEIDVFVTACFTEQGCKDFLARDGHNHRKPFIYAFGSYRNAEFRAVRDWLGALPSAKNAE